MNNEFCIKKGFADFLLFTETDLKGNILNVSKAFLKLTGYSKEELIGQNHSIIKHPEQDKKLFKELWETIEKDKEWIGIIKNIKKDKRSFWERVLIFPKYKNDIKVGYISLREELTEYKKIKKLDQNSLNFNINEKYYNFLFILEIKNFSKLGKSLSINNIMKLKADLEDNILKQENLKDILIFKAISDKYIFFIKTSNKKDLKNKILRIKKDLEEKSILFKNNKIRFLFGGIEINEDNKNFVSINAELALSLAENKKDNIYLYDKEDKEVKEIKESITWKEKTKFLISEKEIYPFFQPIYNLKTNKIEKYEVLARGKIDNKIISPFFFIKYAEELNLIINITEIIIDKSFKYFSTIEDKDIEFSLNISEKDLKSKKFIPFIKEKLKEYDLDPRKIVLEILENITIIDSNNYIINQLKLLKNIGFKLAIDDFGSDNSNFSRLLDINVDYIKIDALFIKNINESKRNEIIVKSIVSMAKILNIKTIAEFVENKEIYEKLKKLDIDYVQGYYIGKPEKEF
jgi:PAS domain S-box-containing protein